MEDVSGEGRMLPFAGNTWNQFVPNGEKPISYLLKKDVPLYFKVDRERHLVCRVLEHKLPSMDETHRKRMDEISWVSASVEDLDAVQLRVTGLCDESVAYLRLNKDSIEELGHSGSCKAQNFTGWSLAKARSYRVTGSDLRGRPIREKEDISKVEDLVKVEFEQAFLIDKDKWNQAKRLHGPGIHVGSPEFRAHVMVKREDLFLDAADIARLKQEGLTTIKWVEYPFRHEERMPGLYWMFQAAYTRNDLDEVEGGDEGVRRWLMENAPHKTYRYKSIRTAEKFVWSKVDRNQGGEERGGFDLEKINSLLGDGARSNYQFDFVSDGLAMILAIADFWFDLDENEPNTDLTVLAQKLMVSGFGGLEVGDLVFLIAGKRMDDRDESNLKKWVDGEDELEWRDVRELAERERSIKKRAREKIKGAS